MDCTLMGKTPNIVARELIRWIIDLQKIHRGLQHLKARRTAREPMILLLQLHERDVLTRLAKILGHALALLEGNDCVVPPMHQQNRRCNGRQVACWEISSRCGSFGPETPRKRSR